MAKRKRSEKDRAEERANKDALLESNVFSNNWDEDEQDYELKPRVLAGYEDEVVEGLPIKVGGKVERKMRKVVKKVESEPEEESDVEDDVAEPEPEPESDQEPDTMETIIKLKEEIAELVAKLTEEPEEHCASLKRLVKMAHSKNPNTAKFSLLSLVPVLKNLIPGYRIRALTEAEQKEKVSKDVAKLRNFEQNLISSYKKYVELLVSHIRTPNNAAPGQIQMGTLATNAACELLLSAHHFNNRSELLAAIIRRICKPNPSVDSMYQKCIKTLESLLDADDEGALTLDIMRIMNKTIKTRNYRIEESVLNILLAMSLLDDYDPNATEEEKKQKIKKKDRVHLSKKERKARKERKAIDEEMRKAEQAVSAEERERNQSEVLKLTLALYLNILKNEPDLLIASVLEGLSKFGHMANFDLLGDFLEVIREIIETVELDNLSPIEVRKVLLCIVTSFALVSNHNQTTRINVDLSSFVDALYAILPYLSLDADIEFSHKSLRLADPLNDELIKPSVNVSTKAELLLKGLDHIFFRSKSGSKTRSVAFTKRLYMFLLQSPEKTSIAVFKFMEKLMARYNEINGLYSTEDRIGNGAFHMDCDEIARSNAEAATIWENVLLQKHYCPVVSKGARTLLHRSKENKS